MKLNSRTKKIMILAVFAIVMLTATGCSIPRDESGAIKAITDTTTFSEVMKEESWFQAIFVWPVAKLINWLAPTVGVGGAIAIITIVINSVLAVLTLKSTVSSQRMQMMQPELQKIQRKYEGRNDDASKMRMSAEMNKLYQKYDVNPMSTILITFLQMPVIFAMYMAVQRASAVQTGTFFGLKLELTPLEGIKSGMYGYIALFLFMAVTQLLSMYVPQYMQKKKAEKEAAKHHRRPEDTKTSSQTTMQLTMMVMIFFLGATLPSAMSLYWGINSLVNVVKSIVTQKYIETHDVK